VSQAQTLDSYEWGDPRWNIEEIVDAWAVRKLIDEAKVDDDDLALIDAGIKSEADLPPECFKRLVLGVAAIPGHDTKGVPTSDKVSAVIRVNIEYNAPLVDEKTGEPLANEVLHCDVYLN
jgi:hypothetical protein